VPKSGKEALAKTAVVTGAAAAGMGGAALLEAIFGGAEAAGDVGSIAVDANKLHHIFADPTHNLGPLVDQFGSETNAFNAVQQAAQAGVKSLPEFYKTVVSIGGQDVTVTGRVIEGIVRIGTLFIP
jgi:hypothetical protein